MEVQQQHVRPELLHSLERARHVAALAHHREPRLGFEQHAQPAAHHDVVVREHDRQLLLVPRFRSFYLVRLGGPAPRELYGHVRL
jgi:hypothetical protein